MYKHCKQIFAISRLLLLISINCVCKCTQCCTKRNVSFYFFWLFFQSKEDSCWLQLKRLLSPGVQLLRMSNHLFDSCYHILTHKRSLCLNYILKYNPSNIWRLNNWGFCQIIELVHSYYFSFPKVNLHIFCQTTFVTVELRGGVKHKCLHTLMTELLRWDFIRFERLAWVGDWRYTCQRNVQHIERPKGVKAENSSWIFSFSLASLHPHPSLASLFLFWLW